MATPRCRIARSIGSSEISISNIDHRSSRSSSFFCRVKIRSGKSMSPMA